MIKHGSLHRDIKWENYSLPKITANYVKCFRPDNVVLEAQEEKLTGSAVLVDYGM